MPKRILHVTAHDLQIGDECSFINCVPTEFIRGGWEDKNEHQRFMRVADTYCNSWDWDIFLMFEDDQGNRFSLFTDPLTQFTLRIDMERG